MIRTDIELLAPVGSRESLTAALRAGAVYFGAGRLNMRARSSAAFGLEDIEDVAAAAAEAGARSYLTLNTALFDDDLPELRRTADAAKEAAVSALIVSDVAAMEYARKIGMEVHLSTQANVSNAESLRFFSRWADTVVLARELSLERVSAICRAIESEDIRGPSGGLVRIELFAHGALCMAVSGKCYLSLHRYGSSANRGECLQNCRRKYMLTDMTDGSELVREEDYFLSPKDLKTIHFLDRILAAGVRSLKIEGRARSADYVRATVESYSQAIEAVIDGSYTTERIAQWDKRLAEVFNRGFWDGWYLGATSGERAESYGAKTSVKKVILGVCNNYFSKAKAAEFCLESGILRRGDRILITGPSTGAVRAIVTELRVDDKSVDSVEKGALFSVPMHEKLRKGDKLFRLDDSAAPATEKNAGATAPTSTVG